MERSHLSNFDRGHYKEQFYEFISNLGQWFRRCRLKRFFILGSGGPRVQLSGTIYAILEDGIMGDIPVKL